MEANQILSTDLLDIIFEGRNKSYGAYDLRKTYNQRVSTALLITFSIAALIFACSLFLKKKQDDIRLVEINGPTLEKVDLEEKKVPSPAKLKAVAPIKMQKNLPPIIVKEKVIKPDEKPPEINELMQTQIGSENRKGGSDNSIPAPPVESKGSEVVQAASSPKEDEDKPFYKVEIEASFPGGEGAWARYVTKEIQKNIDELTEAGESGTCRVKFIVDKAGNVSNVEATTMRGTKLAEIAVNAIRKGPKVDTCTAEWKNQLTPTVSSR